MDGKPKNHYIIIPWVLFFLACICIGYLVFFSSKNTATDDKQTQAQKTIAAVGKLMILPDEVPTIARIVDPKQLKGQVFFQDAQVGDMVLIYVKSQKAILYDPAANKIVALAPLNTSDTAGIQAPFMSGK